MNMRIEEKDDNIINNAYMRFLGELKTEERQVIQQKHEKDGIGVI